MKAEVLSIARKVYTVVVDRRFWFALLVMVSVLAGKPDIETGADAASQEIVDVVVVGGKFFVLALTAVAVLLSWGNRPPSGTNFKDVFTAASELYDEIEDLKPLIQKLKEIGIE